MLYHMPILFVLTAVKDVKDSSRGRYVRIYLMPVETRGTV